MKALLAALAAATVLSPAAAQAQGDPWNPPAGGHRDHDRGDRAIYAGDFVIIPKGDDFLLLDSKTGCIWRRDNAARFGAGDWIHEFPAGYSRDCSDRLAQARTSAREGRN